jgi:hypothetical protein
MDSKLQVIAVLVTALLLFLVFELVRRRRLLERYALLWLLSAVVLLVLASWSGLLERVSSLVGIATPSNALFVIGFAFVLVLLLHFSLAVSRLTDETKILAQQVARLDAELRDAQRELGQQQAAPDGVAEAEAPRLAVSATATARQEGSVADG